jgi:RNA polymerase sigma factor (sigma-70 family)
MKRSRPMGDDSIGNIRDTLTKHFQRLVHSRARAIGMPVGEFREWVDALVGEGIAVALRDIDKWDETRGDFLCWAFLKTRSLFNRDLRKRRNRVQTVELIDLPTVEHRQHHDPPKRLQVKEQLKEIFEALTTNQGEALILRYLLGFTPKEMEALTGRPGVNIYALLKRAKKRARTSQSEAWKEASRRHDAETPNRHHPDKEREAG